jgi:hypothetical protein
MEQKSEMHGLGMGLTLLIELSAEKAHPIMNQQRPIADMILERWKLHSIDRAYTRIQ